MALGHGPEFILDNLVFHLDFGNPRCYSGSGLTSFDLSFSGNSTTSINNPTFSTTNKGYFEFTTGSQKQIVAPSQGLSMSGAKSVFAWIKPNVITVELAGDRIIYFTPDGATLNDNKLVLAVTNDLSDTTKWYIVGQHVNDLQSTSVALGGAGYPVSSWYYIGWTYSGTGQSPSPYVNGVGVTCRPAVGGYGYPANFNGFGIGARPDSNTFDYNGYIAIVSVYKKDLSPEEVLQNYNATRSRFGL